MAGSDTKNPVGRPTIMTKEIIAKLEQAFAIGCSDKEACLYAGISHQTLYDYQKLHPEFVDRKEQLKETPVLKARQTVFSGLDKEENAKWFLERKMKREFSLRTELTGPEGKDIIPIYGGQSVIHGHDGDKKDIQPKEKN